MNDFPLFFLAKTGLNTLIPYGYDLTGAESYHKKLITEQGVIPKVFKIFFYYKWFI